MLDGNTVDVDGLHTQRAAMQARLDDLAAMFADGAIDASQLRRGTSDLRTQLAGIDNTLGELSRRSPVADLIAAGDKLQEHWDKLSPDMKGKVVQEIWSVTVQPGRRGAKAFDYRPDRHRLEGVTMAWALGAFAASRRRRGTAALRTPRPGKFGLRNQALRSGL